MPVDRQQIPEALALQAPGPELLISRLCLSAQEQLQEA